MFKEKWFIRMGLTILAFILLAGPAPKMSWAADGDVAEFYRDNVLTVIAPYGAGGGTDYAARLFASYWSEVSGGAAKVKNMTGAGGIVGTNHVYKAKPDGLTIGVEVLAGTLIGPTLLKEPSVAFDVAKFHYLGLLGLETNSFSISPKLPYMSMDDVRKAIGFKFGANTPSDAQGQFSVLIAEIFGMKDARIISGYSGSEELGLAASRGEIDGFSISNASIVSHVRKKLVKPPFIIVDQDRSDFFPGVPALPETVQIPPDKQWLFDTITSVTRSGKAFVTAPGVSPEKVKFLRDAFNKLVKIKAFIKQAQFRWSVWEKPSSGEKLAEYMQKVMKTSPENIAKVAALTKQYSAIR